MLRPLVILALLVIPVVAIAQEGPEPTERDRLLAASAKVNYAVDKWRYSGEFQVRLDEDMRALNLWYVEGAVTNLRYPYFELVPDLRFSVRPDRFETRPGLAAILKVTKPGWQLALQNKYQADIPSQGSTGHGVRQILFGSWVWRKKFIPGLVGGYFYRWQDDFSDIQFWRAGGGITWVFDPVHSLNVSYFTGWENTGIEWTTSGFLLVQLNLNLRTDWRYVPAKIFSF